MAVLWFTFVQSQSRVVVCRSGSRVPSRLGHKLLLHGGGVTGMPPSRGLVVRHARAHTHVRGIRGIVVFVIGTLVTIQYRSRVALFTECVCVCVTSCGFECGACRG